MRWLLAIFILCTAAPMAQAQSTMGYDALGRLSCVYYPSSTPMIVRYSYDAAGNRTSKTTAAAAGQTCTSQQVGPPPTQPVQLTALNPSATVPSEETEDWGIALLGEASDNATLSLMSATTSGGAGACGTASTTSSLLSYEAPPLTPASATLTCYIDYVFSHPNTQQKSGRVTLTIQGADPPNGGGEDPPPCEIDPQTGLCVIE